MKKAMKNLEKVLDKMVLIERCIGAFLLFVMLVICFSAVVMRYCFNSPWPWSEEVILVLLVVFGYLCISIDVYHDEHVALTFLYNKVPPVVQRVLDVFRHVVIGIFFGLMTHYGYQIYLIKAPKALPITGWSQGIAYLAQFLLAAITVLFCAANILKVFCGENKDSVKESEEVIHE